MELTSRYLLEIIRINEGDEFLAYYPAYKEEYGRLQQKYKQLIQSVKDHFETVKGIEDKKPSPWPARNNPSLLSFSG